MKYILIAFVVFFAPFGVSASEVVGGNTYVANKYVGTPLLDGVPRELLGTDRIKLTTPSGTSATYRVAYDDSHVYIGFEVEDAFVSTAGEQIWEDDSAEVFFNVITPVKAFLNADGAGGALQLPGVRTAVHRGTLMDEKRVGWSGEMLIPWNALLAGGPGEPGSVIGFDVNHNDHPQNGIRSVATWRNNDGDSFNNSEGFGELSFSSEEIVIEEIKEEIEQVEEEPAEEPVVACRPNDTLFVGDDVVVNSDGTRLNVRVTANGDIRGKQLDGSLGVVTKDGEKVGAYRWYKVDFDNQPDGFVAGAFIDKVCPITSTDSEEDVQDPLPEEKFEIGEVVRVDTGDGARANVRDERNALGVFGTRLGQQNDGSLGTILDGPEFVPTSGFKWWKVDFETGTDGWVREDLLREYASGGGSESGGTINVGDRIRTNTDGSRLNVRKTPGGNELWGQQVDNAFGTVTVGETVVNGTSWYKVNFDNNPDGYVSGDYIVKVGDGQQQDPDLGPDQGGGSGGTEIPQSVSGGPGLISVPAPPTTPISKTYYVATNGNDSNPGTNASPWKTINKANNTLKAGERVIIKPGTYNQIIDPKNSGTANARIYYEGQNGAHVNGTEQCGTTARITKNYITLKNLNLRNDRGQCKQVGSSRVKHVDITGNNNQLLDSEIRFTGDFEQQVVKRYKEQAITVAGSNNLIQGNDVFGMEWALALNGNTRNNVVRDNKLVRTALHNISLGSSGGADQGHLIESNIIGESWYSDGIQSNGNFDLPIEQRISDTSTCGIVARHNIIYGGGENNIDVKGSCRMLFEKNVIYGSDGDNDGTGGIRGENGGPDEPDRGSQFTIYLGSRASSKDVIIRNNVVYDNGGGIGTVSTWNVYNNTIVNNNRDYTGPNTSYSSDGKGLKVGWGVAGSGTIVNNIIGDHQESEISRLNGSNRIDGNLIYNTFQNPLFDRGDKQDSVAWNTFRSSVSGIGSNNLLVGDPQLRNVPPKPKETTKNLDFRPNNSSRAIDAGVDLTTTRSSGSGRTIPVQDSGFFTYGFGAISGDRIRVGNTEVTVTAVNYSSNTITVDRSISWSNGAPVNLVYKGSGPDIGAYEIK